MIRFENVTKTYKTNVGLDNVSVHIKKGDFVFLVGPSGAGKSTFIKLILKEIDADEGSIMEMKERGELQISFVTLKGFFFRQGIFFFGLIVFIFASGKGSGFAVQICKS